MVDAAADTVEATAAAGVEVKEQYSGDNVRASWPFSLHNIRNNLSHCSPEGRDALVSAFLWCTDNKHPIRREDFATRVDYSANVIYKLLSGKYVHPDSKKQMDVPPDLVRNIKHFLALERERFLGGANEFVLTPTAKKIFTSCDLARESQSPVFLWGPSHIGKTWALERYAADNNHGRTVYFRMKAASGLGGMVRRMCEGLGVSPNSNTAELTDRIKRAVTRDMLLIFDELHLLMYTYRRASFFGCLEVIREIYDEVQCGVVLCGTRLMLDKINEGQRGEMEQLLRRGVHRTALPDMPTKADLTAILEHWKLSFPREGLDVSVQGIHEKPYEVVRQLAKKNGLKAITERLRYGRKLAQKRGGRLTWEDFIEAHLTIAEQANAEAEWA
jgi:DNA transposition AAA+ family ATPase